MKYIGYCKAALGALLLYFLVACSSQALVTPTPTPASAIRLAPSPTRLMTPAESRLPSPPVVTPQIVSTSVRPSTIPSLTGSFQLCSPLESTPLSELPEIISDPYHPPPMGKDERHQGVDFSYYRRGEQLSIEGVNIQSVLPGKVAAAIRNTFPFGNMLIVETPGLDLPETLRSRFNIGDGESVYTLYAHMASPSGLKLGEAVQLCQVVGQVGKTGNAGVAHLHLEMRHGPAGARFQEMSYYKTDDSAEERANYLKWATSGTFLHFDPMELLSSK